MPNPDNQSAAWVESQPGTEKENQRFDALNNLGLLEVKHFPIFDEATQTATHFLSIPICILGIVDGDRLWFKSASGLSRIGLMNDLSLSRQLPRNDTLCNEVVTSCKPLALEDTLQTNFADSILVSRYGIRAYLGVPLLTSDGQCLGTLAVMDLTPRQFSSQDMGILELIARWSMSELERCQLSQHPQGDRPEKVELELLPSPNPQKESSLIYASMIKANLIAQMTQELRTPLTSILGMASMLTREIYGPLTEKQKEYMAIVHNSGQYLLSLVNEILELGTMEDAGSYLNLSPIDVEMLCQQALSTLEQTAKRRDQEIRVTMEPGSRIWYLDKDKVRQMLYHIVFSVIQSSSANSVIRVHVSRRQNVLNLSIWTSHPWLGEGLPQTELESIQTWIPSAHDLYQGNAPNGETATATEDSETTLLLAQGTPKVLMGAIATLPSIEGRGTRQNLGILLSRQLAAIHGGDITIQGSHEAGYRYVIALPQISEPEEEQG